MTLRSYPSAYDVQETLTSAQEAMKLSQARQGNKETLPYAQDNLRLASPFLGAQGPSQFSQQKESLELLSFSQGSAENSTSSPKVLHPSYDQGAVAQVTSVPGDGFSPSAQGILQTLPSSHIILEMPPSVQRIVDASLAE